MIVGYILIGISFILDGVLTNFLPYNVSALSLFTPLTTIVCLVLIYPFFYHQEKRYYIVSLIVGLLYDLFYTNMLFYNCFLFLLVAFVSIKLYKIMGTGIIKNMLIVFITIVSYETVTAIMMLIFNLVPVTPYKLIYKIGHSLILNLIYAEILYGVLKLIPKKYYKFRIN